MTVPATTRKAGPYTGNGVQTVYPYAFKVFAITDVKVITANLTGAETVLSSGFTVSMNADQVASPGGNVTLSAALTSGYKLTVLGALPYDQTLAIPGGGNYNPVTHENALDRLLEQIQQVKELVDRAVLVTSTSGQDPNALIASLLAMADSSAAAAASATSALGYLNAFKGQYYGPLAADPTLDPLGAAMGAGDLYWNTVSNVFKVYNGAAWTVFGTTNATNLTGATPWSVPYQSAASVTSYVAPGTAGQVLTSAGPAAPTWATPAVASGGFSNLAVFTASGTWTIPAGITKCKVTVVGGGGSGISGGCGTNGGGGGGGGTAIKVISGLTPGGTVAVTVGGTSGTSSFGAYCSATGGATGIYYGAPGGVGSSGDLNLGGGSGSPGVGAGVPNGGDGGSSALGGGGAGGSTAGGGTNGRNYGGGGGGAGAGTGVGGGAGGVVIVEY